METLQFQTVEDAQELLNVMEVYEVIEMIEKSNKFVKPERLSKPRLVSNPTSQEAKEYAIALEKYENDLVEYNKLTSLYGRENKRLSELIVEFICEESGLNNIPEKSRGKVWSKAYQDGHSSGYYSVYQELCELVELF